MTLFIQYCLYVLGSIHHFHIDHNAPCLPPKILHNHCLSFFLEQLRNWKQKFCKILGGKQGSLWSMWKWWIDISGALANLAFVRSYSVGLLHVYDLKNKNTVQNCSYFWFLIALVSGTSMAVANGEIEESFSFTYTANVRFKLRISQSRKWADKNSSKQFLWIKNWVKPLIYV